MKSVCVVPSYRVAIAFARKPSARTAAPVVWNFLGRTAILTSSFLLTRQSLPNSVALAVIGSTAIEAVLFIDAYRALSRKDCQ